MAVYLEKHLAERGGAFNYDDLRQAVKDGARLRLRPVCCESCGAIGKEPR